MRWFPQAPQLLRSLRRFASQPVAAFPSQLLQPAEQDATVHNPSWQLAVPFAIEQGLEQAPQLSGSFRELISHPEAAFPSQFVYPGRQVEIWQVPPEHVANACGRLQT
jgi:hypothetical protein